MGLKSKVILLLVSVALLGCAGVSKADWLDPNDPNTFFIFDVESNYTGWWDNTYTEPTHLSTGGNPDGHFEISYDATYNTPWLIPYDSAQGGTSGHLVGDLFRRGDRLHFTVDVKTKSGSHTTQTVRYELTGDSSLGKWCYYWSGEWDSTDGWITLEAPLDVNWTDAQAKLAGWLNAGTSSFVDTASATDKYCTVRIHSYTPAGAGYTAGIDNWGYYAVTPEDEPNGGVIAQFETEDMGYWQNWRDGSHDPCGPVHVASGGNPGGYFESNTGVSPYFYPYDSTYGKTYFSGDLSRYGDRLNFTVDVKILDPDRVVENFYFQQCSHWSDGWYYVWSGPFDSTDGWITLTAPMDANWTDEEAWLNGWWNSAYDSFNTVMTDADGLYNGNSCLLGARPILSGESFQFAMDNYGYYQVDRPAPVERHGFVFDFGHYDDSKYWQANGGVSPNRLGVSTNNKIYYGYGGNSAGCFELSADPCSQIWLCPFDSKWAGNNPGDKEDPKKKFVGDVFVKNGYDRLNYTVDVEVQSAGVSVIAYELTYVGDYTVDGNGLSQGNWRYYWYGPFDKDDGWITLTAPMDAAWSDMQAEQHGWEQRGTDSFVDTIRNTTKYVTISTEVYTPETSGITLRIDNWGYISSECGDINHLYPQGDCDEDCHVDLLDFSNIAEGWISAEDIDELKTLVDHWLEQNDPRLE
ncbi:MAG: hypothetical protein ABIG61_04100 [Planctomycetota bacterium]